jgi:ribosomal protein S24E
MEIKERKENKVLNRVEISFSWRHDSKATPSRQQVMDLVRTLEPGSNPDWIVVKDCVTRFGQPLTTGLAYIYGSEEAMAVEPGYIHKRHEAFRTAPAAPEEAAPVEEETAGETEGGDE